MDPNIVTIIVALLINIPTLYLMSEEKRKRKFEAAVSRQTADDSNVKTAMELREQMRKDREEYRADYIALREKFEMIEDLLEREREERKAEQVIFKDKLADMSGELSLRDRVIMDMKNEITKLRRDYETVIDENVALKAQLDALTKGLTNEQIHGTGGGA
jgi:hypothetical protein